MYMKKYIILYAAAVVTVLAILTSGTITNAAVESDYCQVKKADEESTITASGKLQYIKEEKITSDSYWLIDKILVSDGDRVKKGDPLLSVYEVKNTDHINYSFPESENIMNLISKNTVSQEIKDEIQKYALYKTIEASTDGIISSVSYKDNTIINRNSLIMKISDTKDMCIKINVNETCIEQIKKDQKVNIRFAAVENKIYKGKVIGIAGEAKQTGTLTGKETTVEVTIKMDRNDPDLRIGYTAECTVITSLDKNILVLPYEYIYSDEKGDYVFLFNHNAAKKIYIRTGKEYKDGIQITSGVKENDKILKPSGMIEDGKKISLKSGEKYAGNIS